MEGNRNEGRIIIDPTQNGIVYEDHIRFGESIFRSVYEKAKTLTAQIVQDNLRLQKSMQHGNEFRNRRQMDNVIAFVGRRGTGKTSAMLSFLEAMRDHNKNGYHLIDDREEELEFVGLESIDASMLQQNENIFDAILANIFGEFQKQNKNVHGMGRRNLDYDTQDLYQQFEKIYTQISNLEKRERFLEQGNVLDALGDLARSSEVRRYFTELIRSYIKYINEKSYAGGQNYRNTYLVVAIDDIDVNIKKGYQILEEIHRYLMVPGLIVLIAVDYEEMLLCCEKRYVKAYCDFPESVIRNKGKRIMQMGEKYLEKILPPYMRIYLPSLKKMDYAVRESRRVRIDGKEMEMKEGLFRLIWEKTGVYYDAGGKKRHFVEPETLRGLSGTFQLYNGMEDLKQREGEKEEGFFQRYDNNYHMVMDDILFRLACDYLPNREYEMFIKWSEEEILRRGEEIADAVVIEFPEWLSMEYKENIGSYKNAAIMKFVEDYDTYGYSYGELLRSFYCISHIEELYDKRLIHILLQQYTVAFSRIYAYYVRRELPLLEEAPDAESRAYKNRDTLKKLMGTSVGGSWARYMAPRVEKIKGAEPSYWGACTYSGQEKVTLCNLKDVKLMKSIVNFNKERKKGANKNSEADSRWEACEKLLKNKKMQIFGALLFFFSDFDDSLKWNHAYTFDIKDPNEKKEYYQFCFKEGRKTFNIFNFINNSFDYYNTIKNYYMALCEAFTEKGALTWSKEEAEEKVRLFMETEMAQDSRKEEKISAINDFEYSLLRHFKLWSKDGGLAVPVYNFDITYNLFKRILVECKREEHKVIAADSSYEKLKELFQKIQRKLSKQDDFYNKNGTECSNFAGIFAECPIVKLVLGDNATLKEAWNAYMGEELKTADKEASQKGLTEDVDN